MPEPEYTPAPWEIREAYIPGDGKHDDDHFGAAVFHIYQVGELLHYVAEIGQCSPNAKGNAGLIVTAPEMLAKLIEFHTFIVDQYGESEEAEELASLIAKAKGE